MKAKLAALFLAASALFASVSCEQHKWSETQKLFQEHKPEASGHDAKEAK